MFLLLITMTNIISLFSPVLVLLNITEFLRKQVSTHLFCKLIAYFFYNTWYFLLI